MVGNARAQELLLAGIGRSAPSLSGEFLAILAQGVVYRGELVTLASNRQPLPAFSAGQLLDAVGMECFVNHLHLDDDGTFEDEVDAFQKCLVAAKLLYRSLKGIGCRAKVLISVAEETNVTLRFHKIRLGQEWLAGDLEGYDSAILVLEV